MAQTDIQTHGHGDSMTDPAQRAESVKIQKMQSGGTSQWMVCNQQGLPRLVVSASAN